MRRYFMLPLFLLLAGCGTQVLTQGEPNFNTAILLPPPAPGAPQPANPYPYYAARDPNALQLTPASAPPACNELPTTTDKTKVSSCVYAVVAIIDDLYREYRITLHHLANGGNAAADISVLGLTTAATGPVGATTGKVLTGIAAFITGSKSVINQDILYKQTIENIIHQMDTDRATRLTNINTSMSGVGYTLAQAKDDLLLYFAAGTWDDAITSMQTTLASNQANCQAQADQSKVSQAQIGTGSGAGGSGPAATPTNCPPAPAAPPPLAYTAATNGTYFQAASGVGLFKVTTAPTSATSSITVAFSPDGKSFSPLKPMQFSLFVTLVNPVPVKPPSP